MSFIIPGITPLPDVEDTYPGYPLILGSDSNAVLNTKNALNLVSVNFPAIPKITPVDTNFDESLESAVKMFQNIFNLPITGIIDKATWYEIRKIYGAVLKFTQTTLDGSLPGEIPSEQIEEFEDLAVVPRVQLMQYFLNVLSAYYDSIPAVDINGKLNEETMNSITEFQKTFNLPATGVIDDETWEVIYSNVRGILSTLPPTSILLPALLYPQEEYMEGMENPGIYIMQQFLVFISSVINDIPTVIPDEYFGPVTKEAVIAFQNIYNIEPTGVVNEETWNKIVEVYRQLRFSETRVIGQYPGTIIG